MLASLGKDPTDDYLEAMMNEAPGPINFTMFLTLFGERLQAGFISIHSQASRPRGGQASTRALKMLLTLRGCRFGMPFWEGEIRAGYDSKNQESIQNPDFLVNRESRICQNERISKENL